MSKLKTLISNLWFNIRIRGPRWYLSPLLILALLSTGWGPITHYNVADQVGQRIVIQDIVAFRTGAVMPDADLATLNWGLQGDFHQVAYVNNLWNLSRGSGHLESFALGYATHFPVGDPIEEAVPRNPAAPNAVEWVFDSIIAGYPHDTGYRIVLTKAEKQLMRDAFDLTYPTHWLKVQYPADYDYYFRVDGWANLDSAAFQFNAYFQGAYYFRWVENAESYYPGWRTPVADTVNAAVAFIQAKTGGTPIATPSPTPSPTVVVTPTATPQPTPTPGPTPTATPIPATPTAVPSPVLTPSPSPTPSPTPYVWPGPRRGR
mgnify:CR=1 FL=1